MVLITSSFLSHLVPLSVSLSLLKKYLFASSGLFHSASYPLALPGGSSAASTLALSQYVGTRH